MRKALGLVAGLLFFAGLAFAAVPKDTYVYMTFGDIDTLDPAQAYDTASLHIIENVYETLFTYKKGSLTEYEPLLATRYEIKDGGKTYIFHLRKGVQFHSGNPMTCRDAEYSFERILVTNPGDGPGWFFAESLIGYGSNAKSALGENASPEEYEKYWELIDKSVECDDLYTLRFTLVKPDPTFFAKLLYAGAAIVDSKWAIEHGEGAAPRRTGSTGQARTCARATCTSTSPAPAPISSSSGTAKTWWPRPSTSTGAKSPPSRRS